REIVQRVDPETMVARPASQLALNEIGLVRLETGRALVFDRYRDNRQTGAFVLIDRIGNTTLGAGMVEQAIDIKPHRHEDAAITGLPTATLRELIFQALLELERRGGICE